MLTGIAHDSVLICNLEQAPHFPLKHSQKDVNLACALGDEIGVEMPMAKAANNVFKKALEAHGDDDFSAVITAIGK